MPNVIHAASVVGQAGLFGALTADLLTMKGTWDYPVVIGVIYLWNDTTTDCLRVKRSAPASITDGTILVEG